MLRHYVKTALRHLRRQKGYAFLNATGLALGLACAMLAVLYIRDETSFDRFHEGGDRLLAVVDADSTGVPTSEATPFALGEAVGEMPEVEAVLRADWGSKSRMRRPGGPEVELEMVQTESSFFTFFSFPITQGSPQAALEAPNPLVLTRESAQTLFGDDDPIGETVEVYRRWPAPAQWVPLQVTALALDPPAQSTVTFEAVTKLTAMHTAGEGFLAPDAWGWNGMLTYARLRPGTDYDAFAAAMPDRVAQVDASRQWHSRLYVPLPLAEVYFSDFRGGSSFTGERDYLRLFGAIALVVLLIALLNYINLSTVRSMKRAREVGVRKAVGAGQGQVARQMLVEAVLLAVGAFALALVLVWGFLPLFNDFFGKEVSLHVVREGRLLLALLGGAVLTGVLAGLYPSFVLARYRPTQVLRAGTPAGPGGGWLRRGLVVTQFAATIGLLVYTGLVFEQIDHLSSRYPLPENARLATLDVPNEWRNRTPTLKQALRELPGVQGVTATSGVPGRVGMAFGVTDSTGTNLTFATIQADRAFMRVMNLAPEAQLEAMPDLPLRMFVNQAAMRQMGKPWTPGVTAPLGLVDNGISSWGSTPIAGVLRDFPFESLRKPIEPMMVTEGADSLTYGMIVARVDAAQIGAFTAALPGVWQNFSERPPEVQYVDDFVAELYKGETQLAQIVTFFSLLALLVACLGLFGLAAFSAAQRTKEIGVRKVLGASVGGLVGMLSKDFVALVLVACVVAMPLAYWVASRWLEGFVEQAPMSPLVFALVALGALLLALATVASHAYRAARANPVKSLRYE